MTVKSKWAGKRRKGKAGGARSTDLRMLLEAASLFATHVIGIDPDLHSVGLAGWDLGKKAPGWVACTKIPKEIKGQQCAPSVFRQVSGILGQVTNRGASPLVIVEGQRIRKDTPNPQSIVDLAACAGACVGAALAVWPTAVVIVAEPGTWAGSVPKDVRQKRTYLKLGWAHEKRSGYYVPSETPGCLALGGVTKAEWKHIGDGLGIAEWGRDQLHSTKARLKRRAL